MNIKEFITRPDSSYNESTVHLFNIISKSSLVSSFLGGTTYCLSNLLQSSSSLPNEILYGSFVLWGLWLLSTNSTLNVDLTQIKKLYIEFIKEYNRLNREFGFNHPIQVYKLFNYMLYNGYLSTNKRFYYDIKQCIDVPYYSGASIMTGTGCCRHISALLTDVLNDYGFFSSQIEVSNLSYLKFILSHIMPSDKIASHAITATSYSGELYFFDSTWKVIGVRNGKNISEYGTFNDLYKIRALIKYCSSTPSNLSKKDIFSLPNPVNDLNEIVRMTQEIINGETGRLEEFYTYTKDLREDLAEKTLSFKPIKSQKS